MKLSMHRHFILLAIAILFQLNKIASHHLPVLNRRLNRICHTRFIYNTGNVVCGGHRAKTCSECPCNGGRGTWSHLFCNGDCQWSGDIRGGACHMRKKPIITRTSKGRIFAFHLWNDGTLINCPHFRLLDRGKHWLQGKRCFIHSAANCWKLSGFMQVQWRKLLYPWSLE